MRIFAGPLRIGYKTILTALLLPVLGFGVANADMSVGDTVMLKVPDLSEFPLTVEEHQFTCRAVTENAYWLVQDSVSVPEGTGPGIQDTIVWNNLITQGELDTLTAEFEGNGVDVYGTVTEYLGDVPDTDNDPRIWIVMATIRDVYLQSPTDRRVMAYVNPADVDTTGASGDFNNQDIFYINLHTYSDMTTTLPIAKGLRRFFIPNGLGMLIRTSVQPVEEQWVVRGLGAACQYLCYGITRTTSGNFGLYYDLGQFEKCSFFDLTFYESGGWTQDYAKSRGQEFLWFMYLAQREGDDVLEAIAQSGYTDMLNVANAIDSSIADSIAIQTNVVPIYIDWLVCNLTNDYRDDMSGGIYTYEIFSDTSTSFTHIGQGTSFEGRFDSGDYPLPVWMPGTGMESNIWASQYCEFTGDYTNFSNVYFNGAFADDNGSGSLIDGNWIAIVVSLDTVDVEILSVEEVSLDNLFNGSFELDGDNAYLIVTNNNPGGALGIPYILSQDSDLPELLLASHQNSVNDQYMTIYTTLFDSIPEGFDWYGPVFTATTGDSSSVVGMGNFWDTIWDTRFNAWETGEYTLSIAGYDSSGFSVSNSRQISVGFVTTGSLSLSINAIHLDVMAGAAAPGTMVSLCESNILDLSMDTQVYAQDVVDMMTGINAGPVSIPGVNSTLSFPAESSEGAVYRYTAYGWEQLDSYYQNGRMCALVSEGGNYVYGQAPGVVSPEIPAEFHFGGTYPNPFNAEAAIRFSLPSSGRVSVTIYDLSGRAVRTLNDTEMQAAEHTLMWDGLDETGNAVGAGVYFCRLQACGETVTQKMLRIE
ncbi:MAG: T9SS type A sorting domain-containing protein [Candidatus Aegiribacteria sp.]|nr:T9SS type A sorting domain-containing protein [Candidatus Aegiribacteria sp.]